MRQLANRLLLSILALTSLSCAAQNYVAVTKPNVNLRQAPSVTAPVVMKAPLGTLFEVVSKQPEWYEVKEALTDRKAYISTTVVRKPETTSLEGIVGIDENAGYENVTKNKNSETTATYMFWSKDNFKSDVVYASLSTSYADTSGRMRSSEKYYKGKQAGWYIVLTEETDYEGTVQDKLEQPILIFKEATGKSGIYILGLYYKEAGNPFE